MAQLTLFKQAKGFFVVSMRNSSLIHYLIKISILSINSFFNCSRVPKLCTGNGWCQNEYFKVRFITAVYDFLT